MPEHERPIVLRPPGPARPACGARTGPGRYPLRQVTATRPGTGCAGPSRLADRLAHTRQAHRPGPARALVLHRAVPSAAAAAPGPTREPGTCSLVASRRSDAAADGKAAACRHRRPAGLCTSCDPPSKGLGIWRPPRRRVAWPAATSDGHRPTATSSRHSAPDPHRRARWTQRGAPGRSTRCMHHKPRPPQAARHGQAFGSTLVPGPGIKDSTPDRMMRRAHIWHAAPGHENRPRPIAVSADTNRDRRARQGEGSDLEPTDNPALAPLPESLDVMGDMAPGSYGDELLAPIPGSRTSCWPSQPRSCRAAR